ncbi:uncharacterized protein LOC135222585 [Macrobrachium nipponense]|uniref:uncharacterized protein LOC135222585 n=1 Tax=Macrobrachium nipponense TaxID=159736 RepID=UPI0030C831E0
MKIQEVFILTIVLINIKYGLCICYFPGELQGVWATQKSVTTSSRGTRSPIAYQEVTIEADVILQWGMCHAREDNSVILKDNTGGTRCFRCIYLNVASPRVVQVWTMGLETCYMSEEAARSTCPPMQAIASRRAREIMLYKVKSAFGEPETSEVECPLNGRFTFTYRRGHNGASTSYCNQQTSEFSNCPYGIGFNVLYKDCSFPSPLRSGLQCLGSWIGEDDVDYLAVIDTSVKEGDDAPKFKCGMFHEEVGTGRVFLAFSEDSTCANSLKSPRDGYETYEMVSTPPPPLPPFVTEATCKFPKSLMGHWHHTYVADDTVPFKDYRNFKTYSARCVKDMSDGERYIVYSRSHCGDWSYNCLWLKRRSANVLEFMLGLYPRETFDDLLCEVDKFGDMTSWTTQGKSLIEEPTMCPIVGNYVGALPDASGICAQLYSDCSNPQIMFYTVSDCSNFSAVYERDLPGPTSEAGPWLPPEQKVSTGAVLTIVDDTYRRGRRQVSEGQLRVANALTTTISWLWGSSTTSETTTTALGTTTTTTTTSSRSHAVPEWQRPQPSMADGPLQDRNYERINRDPLQNRDYERRINPDPFQNRDDERRLNPDLFSEDGYHQPNTPLPVPPKQDRYDSVGFWPRNRNEHEFSFERASSPTAVSTTPPVFVPGPIRELDSDPEPGVPGRATWVPGSPPGFNAQSTLENQQIPGKEDSSAHESSRVHSPLASQESIIRTQDDSSFLAASVSNRQPLKQGMHEREDRYAWDNRHKYPRGYWLTADPQNFAGQGSFSTEASFQFGNVVRERNWGNSRDSKYSMTDNDKLHETSREPDLVSHKNNEDRSNSFLSDSAPSSLDHLVDLTTLSPSVSNSWRPFSGLSPNPLLPSPNLTLKIESERTNYKQSGVEYAVSDNYDKVRETNSGISEHRQGVLRKPSGRGYWGSSEDNRGGHLSNRNENSDYRQTFRQLTLNRSSETISGRPGDYLGSPTNSLSIDINKQKFKNSVSDQAAGSHLDSNFVSSSNGHKLEIGPTRVGHDISTSGDTQGRGKIGRFPNTDKPHQGHSSRGTASLGSITLPKRKGQLQNHFKEREYQCLGQWEEEGRIYALTYRRDIRTYECFVGIIRSNGVVFIKEAGTECSRGVQPEVLGMKLHRKGDSCPQSSPTSQANKSSPKEDTRPRTMQPPWLRTTRPWKPITAALTIENLIVSCKVGMVCKSAGKEESSPENLYLFLKRRTDKRRVHQINFGKNILASENAIMKRILNSMKLENNKEIGGLKKYFETMLKRSKRESHEKTSVLKNSESGDSSKKDDDFPYSDGGQLENEMPYKGHSLEDPKTEHNSESIHLTATSDTYAEESLQTTNPEINKRQKENLCESSCQQINDDEQMKGLDSNGDANSQNKDTMTFIPTTDHLNFTPELASNRRAIVSSYLNEKNDSYINFNSSSFSSVDMANDTLLNFENHNRSQNVDISSYLHDLHKESLNHRHSPSHWSIGVHEDDSRKVSKSAQYLDPYPTILLDYKPGTTERVSNTSHLEPKDLESVHSHGEDFVHSHRENFDNSGHNHGDTHELENSYDTDDDDDQLQNNDHIHKEKHVTFHGHRYETDYTHPPVDRFDIKEENTNGNIDNTNMYDYKDDLDYENSHAQTDSLTNVEDSVPRSGHIQKDDLAHEDAHDDHKRDHAILIRYGQADEQDHTSDDHHGQHQTHTAVPFANKSADISENHTIEHDEIARHIMPQIDEDFPILLPSEDSHGDYSDLIVTKGCHDGGLGNQSSIQNTTNIFQVANCSDEWRNFENGTTEIEMDTTTEDSDIPKIPISLLEYPTVLPTTVKPSHVTLPPMIWQPFAQPGRPRHRGSGSSGISAASEPLLIGLISFLCIFSNRV